MINDDKETYGVVFEAKTNIFKKKMQEMSQMIRNFGKVAEEEATVTPKINENIYTQQINDIKKRMELLQKEMDEAIKNRDKNTLEYFFQHRIEQSQQYLDILKRNAKLFGGNTIPGYGGEESKTYNDWIKEIQDRINQEQNRLSDIESKENNKVIKDKVTQYRALESVLDKLIFKEKQYNDEIEKQNQEHQELKNQINNTGISIRKMFDGGISKIKRFTYYLLGARSVFSLFMKYQSIYYQYNEKMQYQSELSQNAIALSLAPAFEFLGNMVAYASIGIAKFIELLTGVNVLSKVTTKGIRDYNKSLKETQTLVSGIDEITNLTNPGNLGLASQYQALADFQKKVAEVTKWFDENTWISDIAKGIRDVYEYVSEHWDTLKYVFGAVALAGITISIGSKIADISKTLGTVGTLFGISGQAGTGLLGLAGTLKFLAGLGAISIFISLAIPGIKNDLEEIANKGFRKYFIEQMNKVFDEQLPKTFKNAYNMMINWWLSPAIDTFKENLKPIWQPIVDELGPALELVKNKWDEFLKPKIINPIGDYLKEAKDNIVRNFTPFLNELIKGYNLTLGKVFGEIEYLETETKTSINNLTEEQKKQFDNLFKKFGINIDDMTKKITGFSINIGNMLDDTFKERIFKISAKYNIDKNSVLSLVNKVKGISSLMGVPSSTLDNLANKILKTFGYAKGLDYVPYDNYPALLHKGEAVVPAKYNPTIHSEGNEYTNSLLETLIIKMDDLSKRPNVFEIDGQQFANATYGLYENARNNQNYVEGVVR